MRNENREIVRNDPTKLRLSKWFLLEVFGKYQIAPNARAFIACNSHQLL